MTRPGASRARTATRRSRTGGCSSPRSAAGSTASTRAAAWSGRCPHRSRTPRTPSSCRTAASSSRRSPIPGSIVEMTPSGTVTWSFGDSSGPNLLDKPSLAVRLPNGLIAANDDYGDRVILIDPRTRRIVWQYGHTGVASSAPRVPLEARRHRLPAGEGRRRGRAAAGGHLRRRCAIQRIGSLPAQTSRIAAVALGGDRVMLLGGLAAGSSSDQILVGPAAAPPPRRHAARSRPTTTPPCSWARRCTCSAAARRPRATPSSGSLRPAARDVPGRSASPSPTSGPPSPAAPPTSRADTRARSTRRESSGFAAVPPRSRPGSRPASATRESPRSAG